MIDANLKERMKEASRAEEIVDSEVQAFCPKMQSREVVPTIVQLRDTLEKLRRDEIERNRRHFKDLSPGSRRRRSDHADPSINKILHTPIEHLKQMAHDPERSGCCRPDRKAFNIKPPE